MSAFVDLSVVIPAYNEELRLPPVLERLHAFLATQPLRYEVVVVDDGSRDGTCRVVEEAMARMPGLRLVRQTPNRGKGAAVRVGMLAARGQIRVMSDADGSMPPEQLPRLLAALERGADVAIGSRWVEGGGVDNWPAHRRFISRGGSAYSRIALGLPVKDVTGGYRAFTADALRALQYELTDSQGYCFQIDMTRRAYDAGLRIVEVPITFVERERGASKMGGGIVVEAMVRVTVWGVTGLPRRFRRRPSPTAAETARQA